ncbi:hypothetical protein PSPO01_03835 [Paraphaeosphaeria sporulosa]
MPVPMSTLRGQQRQQCYRRYVECECTSACTNQPVQDRGVSTAWPRVPPVPSLPPRTHRNDGLLTSRSCTTSRCGNARASHGPLRAGEWQTAHLYPRDSRACTTRLSVRFAVDAQTGKRKVQRASERAGGAGKREANAWATGHWVRVE